MTRLGLDAYFGNKWNGLAEPRVDTGDWSRAAKQTWVGDRMGVRIAAWGRRQMDTCERCLGVTGCEGCLDLSW
jgi:hypothetical protein